jgi:lysophospholipid acyltransferase (LPLAT)-like uncharacterized protein
MSETRRLMSSNHHHDPLAVVEANPVTPGGRLAARTLWVLLNALTTTFRWQCEDRSGLFQAGCQQRMIFSVWHNRGLLAPALFDRFARPLGADRRLTAMASASKDGAIAARVMEHFGAQIVRGSSSRRGPQAMAELIDAARSGSDLAITPDGPRGPRYHVQAGVIALAQYAGLPLVPVSCFLSAKKTLRSWDGFQVPLPFSRCEVTLGEPLAVPRRLDEAGREELRGELERRMLAITRD